MAAKEHESTARAVARYLAGEPVTRAAAAENINAATLHRALRKRKIVKRGPPRGPDHHAYVDGRRTASTP